MGDAIKSVVFGEMQAHVVIAARKEFDKKIRLHTISFLLQTL